MVVIFGRTQYFIVYIRKNKFEIKYVFTMQNSLVRKQEIGPFTTGLKLSQFFIHSVLFYHCLYTELNIRVKF